MELEKFKEDVNLRYYEIKEKFYNIDNFNIQIKKEVDEIRNDSNELKKNLGSITQSINTIKNIMIGGVIVVTIQNIGVLPFLKKIILAFI